MLAGTKALSFIGIPNQRWQPQLCSQVRKQRPLPRFGSMCPNHGSQQPPKNHLRKRLDQLITTKPYKTHQNPSIFDHRGGFLHGRKWFWRPRRSTACWPTCSCWTSRTLWTCKSYICHQPRRCRFWLKHLGVWIAKAHGVFLIQWFQHVPNFLGHDFRSRLLHPFFCFGWCSWCGVRRCWRQRHKRFCVSWPSFTSAMSLGVVSICRASK